MTKPLILVTGATGKTGSSTVQHLLERGFPVRALAHRPDARAERLAKAGAEVVFGDFLDLQSMRAAIAGVRRAYFCYPPQGDRLVEATTHIAIGAAHVRPTFFAEMLIILGAQGITSEGRLYLPYGDERHAPVAADDIARVVAGILTDPAPHVGERYVVTGPRNMTVAEMAVVVGEELGRAVEYVDLPIDAWGEVLSEQVGLPEFLVTHLMAVAQDHRDGVFSAQTDVVERIGGRPPQELGEFVREHADLFASPGALIRV